MRSDEHKCQHQACKCIVSAEDNFCSPQCEKRSDTGQGPPCSCGHDDCEISIGVTAPVVTAPVVAPA